MRKSSALAVGLFLSGLPGSASGGSSVFQQTIQPLGSYSDVRSPEEAFNGYGLKLWRRWDNQLVGIFCVKDWLSADILVGVIRNATLDSKTGKLFFRALVRADAPDLYKFQGVLAAQSVRGTLKMVDPQHPDEEPRIEKFIYLDRTDPGDPVETSWMQTVRDEPEWDSLVETFRASMPNGYGSLAEQAEWIPDPQDRPAPLPAVLLRKPEPSLVLRPRGDSRLPWTQWQRTALVLRRLEGLRR